MTENRIVHLTAENFDGIVSGGKLVLVDFWADWCGPCRLMEPLVDLLAELYQGQVTVAKVNIEDALELAFRFRVFSIPALLIFQDGREIRRRIGVSSGEDLIGLLEELLSPEDEPEEQKEPEEQDRPEEPKEPEKQEEEREEQKAREAQE